ncbi:MAG: hypothetical protein KIT67_24785 [Alphaproteobacteria bacterium]|nr:hypothetical protein [Alphaproteobacteria bacterium]
MKNEWHDVVSKFQAWYPDCPPLRWHMRDAFVDRWCRIDNLPGGDRRPEAAEERRAVLERNAAVSTEVLGAGSRCTVILTVPRDPADWSACPWKDRLGATIVEGWIETWSNHPVYGEEAERVRLAVAACDWRPERFRDLILDAATDRNWVEAIIVDLDTGRAYSPWDAGADLFVEDMPTAHALWDKYMAMGWTPEELYTGEPTTEQFPRGFPYEWRTLPWDKARKS